MVDTELLNKKIKDSGLKVSYIVDNLGISRQGFDMKKKNKTPFRVAEIFVLCSLLNIDNDIEKKNIFFANKVE